MQLLDLYDRHSPTLYSLALRILGDREEACAVLEAVFVELANGTLRPEGTPDAWLVRVVRERSLGRQARTASAAVDQVEAPTPRRLVEQVFYGGRGVDELARAYALPPERVRAILCDGMAELRREFAARER